MKIFESKLLSIEAEIDNNLLKLTPIGSLSILAKPVLKKVNEIFEEEKAILAKDNYLVFSSWIPPIPSIAFNKMIYAHCSNTLFKNRIPDQLSISVTARCPNKCIHCGAFDMMDKNKNDIEIKKIKNIVNQALKLGTYLITIDGGEPLLRNDICTLISSIQTNEAIISMFTSGYSLTEEKAL